MELLGLPFELILQIWDFLEKPSHRDAFARTCGFLYNNLNCRLYRQAVTQGPRELVEWATQYCGRSTLRKMLDAGLDPNDPLWGKEPPLMIAVEVGDIEKARDLIDAGADVNAMVGFGNSIASSAVYNGHTDVLNLLIEKGASMDIRVYDEPPILIAAQHQHEDIIEVLLANNVDVDETGTESAYNATALLSAARCGNEAIFRRLLRAGAKMDLSGLPDYSLFYWAIRGGNDGIVSLLLDHGADPHAVDRYGRSALTLACGARRNHQNAEIIRLLAHQNVDIENKNSSTRKTALYAAVNVGFTEAVQILLENNADRSVKSSRGETTLVCATRHGFTDIVSLLMKHKRPEDEADPINKALIDEPDHMGRTPLFLATTYALEEIVKLLLYHGSSAKKMATCAGRTPLSVSRAQMETEHGAKSERVRNVWNLLQLESILAIDREPLSPRTDMWELFDVTCDACSLPISQYDMHYHCSICDDDNYDICQECVCNGQSCFDRTHVWRKTIKAGESWKEVSDSLDQDSILEELTNLRLSQRLHNA